MTRYFVTRHTGALAWAKQHGYTFDVHVSHLEPTHAFVAGDVVAGTLPVNIVADLCAQGVVYLNLSLQLPVALRGQELTAEQLQQCEARLEQLMVTRPTG
jgi:CRISPR-associated protein Csx16